jgi:hypothetical protein
VTVEATLLRPDRKGTYASLGFGLLCLVIGLALVLAGRYVGIVVLLLAAVGLYGAVGGVWPGIGLRLDEQGLRVKSFGKSWDAEWLETERLEPARVRVGRRADVGVVRIHYVGGTHEPQHKLGETLGIDERYVIAAYGGLSNSELAELMERYRTGA